MSRRQRQSLATRYDDSYRNKESTKRSAFSFPQGTKFYKIDKDGVKHAIIIVLYDMKTEKHPLIADPKKNYKIGSPDYVLDIWVHQFVGPEKSDFICLLKNYGKPCPLCEEAEKLKRAGKKDEASNMTASRRTLYNIIDAKHPENGLQVLHHAQSLFEKDLIKEAQSDTDGHGYVDFAGCEEGKVITFRADKESKHGMTFFECNSIRFRDYKEYDITWKDEWLDKAISFDEIMEVLTYDEIRERVFLEPKDMKNDDVQENDSKKAGECPYGHGFGTGLDTKKDCDDCKAWKECEKEYDRIKRADQ